MMMTTMDDLNDPRDFVTVEAESNPDSLQQWLSTVENGKANGTRRSDISTKAKKHLSLSAGASLTFLNGIGSESSAINLLKEVEEERVKDCETAAFTGNKALIVSKKRKERVNVGETAAFNGTKVVLIVDASKKRKRVSDFETAAFAGQSQGEIRPRFEKSLRKVLQVMEKKNGKCEKESIRFWRKDCGPEKNCDVCCVCHFGGDLLLCDGCPSAFHHTCIGLPILPEEELWFCPCCCCDICGSMVTLGNSKLMTCEQCQRKFHLKKRDLSCFKE
ncbi:hypothetical protein Bca52824_094375 [Brassica carinata]|uniref:PHD-type domain-containing protein n=1 Tax=Brassica carinata TaxID=52824 RepID=A0A8X7TKT8_BRACI|nr:hypothetical protein Bca52824_094375 [Brassica carinata]